MPEIKGNPPPDYLKNQNAQDLFILAVFFLIQILLTIRVSFSNLFIPVHFGYIVLAVLFLVLFGILTLSDQIFERSFAAKWLLASFPSWKFRPDSKIFFLIIAIPVTCVGLLMRSWVITRVPLDVNLADMLPLIEKASTALQSWQNPYQVYYFPYPMPLTFLPGLWLPFYPIFVLGLDLRWTGVVLWLIISVLLIGMILEIGTKRRSTFYYLLGAAVITILQLSIELVSFHAIGHTFPLWLWLAITCFAIYKQKYVLTAIGLGLALASRQTAIIFIPIFLVYWFHHRGFRPMLKFTGITGAVFIMITLPFAINSPTQVFLAPLVHYQTLAAWDLASGPVGFMANSIGFSYLLQTWSGPNILNLFYVLVTIVTTGLSFYMVKNRKRMLIGLAVVLAWFNLFTPIPWAYIYYDSLIILSFAILL